MKKVIGLRTIPWLLFASLTATAAHAAGNKVVIGDIDDMSGLYADVIGPGGKVIRGLVEETGCKIDIEDDGTVLIASADSAAMELAISRIEAITAEPEVGRIYDGVVRKIVEFGAFVEIMPGTDGLLHISQISTERIRRVEDVLHEGDEIKVKVLDVDRSGKIRLSLREAQADLEQQKGK